MPYPRSLLLLGLSALVLASPAAAVKPTAASLYVRARAAEALGDTPEANAGFAALLAQMPTNVVVANRAYRQAMQAGDIALALRAAHLLETQKAVPSDARILLALEQVKAHDWVKALAATELLAQDGGFGFLAPYFRAWIAVGSGEGDALALAEGGRSLPLASTYYPEQRALLMIALGRANEASIGLRQEAVPQLPARVKGPEEGLSPLLVHVATDLGRQQYVPVGMLLARMGSMSRRSTRHSLRPKARTQASTIGAG
jgi:hypothetical protein